MSELPLIYAFGETVEDGLFVDIVNDPAAFVLTPNEAHFVFRHGTVPGFPSSGVIPNGHIVRFQVEAVNAIKHVLKEDNRLKLVIEYRDAQHQRRKLDLGTLEKYEAAKNWATTANLHVRSRQLAEEIPDRINERSKIIIQDKQIRVLPSGCLADTTSEYKVKWMEYYAENAKRLITAGTNQNPRIIWRTWPGPDQTWDKIFEGLLLPDEKQQWPDNRIDICFEPYYLDQHREALNYEVARIGLLPNFAFAYTKNGLFPDNFTNNSSKSWQDIYKNVNQKTRLKPSKAGYLVGTTSANFFTNELNRKTWEPDSSKAVGTVAELAEWLLDDAEEETRCAICDFAILEQVKRQQARQSLPGQLKQRPISG